MIIGRELGWPNCSRLAPIIVLGSTQTLAWASSYYLLAILADAIAGHIGISTNWLFVTFSCVLIISAVVGPRMGRMVDAGGSNRVLAGPNLVFALGLRLLGLAHSVPMLWPLGSRWELPWAPACTMSPSLRWGASMARMRVWRWSRSQYSSLLN